jgi:hypothetical protein
MYSLPFNPEMGCVFFNCRKFKDTFKVITGQDYSSKLTVTRSFKKMDIICTFVPVITGKKAWTSIQIGLDSHIELDSELVYMNHSCSPTVFVDTVNFELIALSDLQSGDLVTFFYPSTEWVMDKPFECCCGSTNCLGFISGAKQLGAKVKHWRCSAHIIDLINHVD